MFTISKTSWILLAVLAIGTSQDAHPLINAKCKSNGVEGVCIFIGKCSQALQLLRLGDYDTARNMLCGFDKNDVLVCCPAEKSEDRITYMNKTDDPVSAVSVTTTTTTITDLEETNNEVPVLTTNRPRPPADSQARPRPPLAPPPASRPSIPVSTRRTTSRPSTTSTPVHVTESHGLPDRSVCGLDTINDRIYGGTIALPEEFAWLARLAIRRSSDMRITYACAGSLISDRYVLTAAHCVNNIGLELVEVRLGEWDSETEQDCYRGVCTDPPVDVKVDRTIIHPLFSRIHYINDIALLRLSKAVNFTDFIRPVCLPTTSYIARQDYSSDSVYEAAGWGATEFGKVSPVKRKVKLNAVPKDVCRIAIPVLSENINNTIICAGGRDGADSCRGDSGGPLAKKVSEDYRVNWFIYGITSSGSTACGTETRPGIYTRVSAFMPWILKNMKT